MSAAIVAFCVLSAWFVAFSLCRIAAPVDASERREGDEEQAEFLRNHRAR